MKTGYLKHRIIYGTILFLPVLRERFIEILKRFI